MQAILMFHGVDDSGSVLSVSARELESLILAIRSSGHEIVPLADLLRTRPARSVAFTFDDGFASVAASAAPLLSDLAVPATLFLTTGYVGADNRWPSQPASAPTVELMTWASIERLKLQGWAIEAHSVSHPDLRTLDDSALEHELVGARDVIEQRLGHRSEVLAYPYGYHDARVVRHSAKYYAHAVSTVFEALQPQSPERRLPRLDAYYLRSRHVHRHFGSPSFDVYLAARRALRRAKRHPGEAYR